MASSPTSQRHTFPANSFPTDIFEPQFYGTPNDVYSVLLGNGTLKCYDCLDQQFYNRKLSICFPFDGAFLRSVMCVCVCVCVCVLLMEFW